MSGLRVAATRFDPLREDVRGLLRDRVQGGGVDVVLLNPKPWNFAGPTPDIEKEKPKVERPKLET